MGEELVIIDGHKVDPHLVDRFYNGSDGRRTTDTEWDESKRRTTEFEGLSDEDALARLEAMRRG